MPPDTTLDLKALRSLSGGDAALQRQIIMRYIETADACLKHLQTLVLHDLPKEWHPTAQRLRAASETIHARRMTLACRHAEAVTGNASLRFDAYLQMKQAYQVLLTHIRHAGLLTQPAADR